MATAAKRKTRDEPDFVLWLRANPRPDLQQLVSTYGGYDKIPGDAWADFDQARLDWNERRKTRLGQMLKNGREARDAKKRKRVPL